MNLEFQLIMTLWIRVIIVVEHIHHICFCFQVFTICIQPLAINDMRHFFGVQPSKPTKKWWLRCSTHKGIFTINDLLRNPHFPCRSITKGFQPSKNIRITPWVNTKFFHHSAIISCITFHIWNCVDCYLLNKVCRDILRFL